MLRIFKKPAFQTYIGVSLCSLLLLLSCNRQEMAEPARATSPSLSGQELFRGLFLFHGPAADRLTTFTVIRDKYHFEQQPGLQKELTDLGNRFVEAIDHRYPSFFANFQRAIQSGDQLQVADGMKQGGEMLEYAIQQDQAASRIYDQGRELAARIDLKSVVDSQGRLDEEKLRQVAQESVQHGNAKMEATDCSLAIVCSLFVYISRFVNIFVAINVSSQFAVLKAPNPWIATTGRNSPNDLQREMLVQEIAEKMAVNER
jgi:SdpC family antimicrobial peptide